MKQEEEETVPKITMKKKSNTDGGISFVRIGIEENTIDSDDEVEDEKEVNLRLYHILIIRYAVAKFVL